MKEPTDFGDLVDETVQKVISTKWGKAVIATLTLTFITALIIIPIRNQIPIGEGPLSILEVESMLDNTALFRGRPVVDVPLIIDGIQPENQLDSESSSERSYYAWADATHEIIFSYTGAELKEGDCVLLTGTVVERIQTESMFSNEIVPFIRGKEVVVSSLDIVDPTIKTVQPENTQTIPGLSVTLHNVVLTRNTTRLNVTIENHSDIEVVWDRGVLRKGLTIIDECSNYVLTSDDDLSWEYIAPGEKITGTTLLPPIWKGLKYHETPDKDSADGWKLSLYFVRTDDSFRVNPMVFHFKI